VYKALKANDTEKARKAVSMIVGRDTEKLDDEGIAKAAVETVAENTSDGVIEPLLYTAIGGPVLGFAYKAINTLDSMVGYHNDRYENFGSFSARLDDIVNFIPARISAGLMIISAYICGVFNGIYSGKRAVRIFKRDRFNHKSPNSAQTESVCAGALGIKLAGDASYFGKLVKKPYIGDAERNIENEDIKRAGRLMYISEFICFVFCTLSLFLLNNAVL
jgi:adenosylcobinamide-phosphate synthase